MISIVSLFMLMLTISGMHVSQSTVVPVADQLKDNQGLADDDHYLSFGSICRTKEYPYEQHKVMTADGYILTVFRIPGKKGEKLSTAIAAKRPAILLWHGLLDSADTWILNDEDKAPGFILANQGYDVWLANSRGNKYSREHRFLDPDHGLDEEDFFSFSFDEMGLHDTNSTITYIKTQTGKTKIGVVGFSMGATQFLIGMMNNPTFFKNSVSVFTMLGATSILNYTENPLFKAISGDDLYLDTIRSYDINEVFPSSVISSVFFTVVCQNLPAFCEFTVKEIVDENPRYINMNRLDEMLAHYPSGTSLKTLEHFAQIIKAKRFQRYDYGPELNKLVYGSEIPPAYDLSKITGIKIIQIVGEEDLTSTPADNHWLNTRLSDVIYYGSYRMGHLSFTIGNDITYFNDVLAQLKENAWT